MRIFCPTLPNTGEVDLPPDEATHAIKVMRLRIGDSVELFDGLGASASATIVHIEKNRCVVCIDCYSAMQSITRVGLIVGVGLPKGDRQRSVIERATELGVDELVPLECEFGVAVATDNAIERARRTVIESCKQSGRNHLMVIGEPQRADDWFGLESKIGSQYVLRLICHPNVKDSLSFAELVKRELSMSMQLAKNPSPQPLSPKTGRGERKIRLPLFAWMAIKAGQGERKNRLPLFAWMAMNSERRGESFRGATRPGNQSRDASNRADATPISVQLAIGPEGGFSDRELAIAIENSWQVLDLGPLVLRVETALTAAITIAKLISELSDESVGSRQKINRL